MAYMSQEKKKEFAPLIKNLCKKYNVKASLAVRHHSTIVLNIKSGSIPFIENYEELRKENWRNDRGEYEPLDRKYIQVNEFQIKECFSGDAKMFLTEAKAILENGNHNNSDYQTDYFDVGWYININIGHWDAPYIKE